MILSTVFLAKVLLAVGTVVIFFHEFRDRLSRRWLAYITAAILICAVAVNYAVSFLPPMTEEVTLTALGEKQEAAKGMEVYLSGYTVDGKSYISGKSLEIVEGKWFWKGEIYTWRPETDTRQPEGTTRTVVLKIPVGWNRTLDFNSSQYRGKVEISTYEKQWTVDTYSEEGRINSEQIGRSRTTLLLLNQLRCLALYILVFLALSFWGIRTVQWALEKPEQAREWLDRNSGKIAYGCIALVTFGLMVHYADRVSLWADELSQIAFSDGTIKEAINYCLSMKDCSPPLAEICSTIWYRIAPYGENWLLLPTILLSSLSVFLVGMICERLHGKYCGILAAIMFALSEKVWLNVAYEFRAYAYFIFFSALAYYCHMRRVKGEKIFSFFFSLSLVGLAMSHYFGMIACAFFFLADLYLLTRKQLKIKHALDYLLPGGISIFWLMAVFATTLQYKKTKDIMNYRPVPGFSNIRSMLQFLTGDFEIAYWILLAGIAAVLAGRIYQDKEQFNLKTFYLEFSTLEIVGTVILLLVYGNFVNKESTMWANRYFLGLLLHVIILSASVLYRITAIAKDRPAVQRIFCLFITFAFGLNCLSVISTSKSTSHPYREAADWIYSQNNFIFNNDTMIILGGGNAGSIVDGFITYYITRQGRRDLINVIDQNCIENKNEILDYSKIYIQYSHHSVLPDVQVILDEYYTLESDRKDIKVRVYNRK